MSKKNKFTFMPLKNSFLYLILAMEIPLILNCLALELVAIFSNSCQCNKKYYFGFLPSLCLCSTDFLHNIELLSSTEELLTTIEILETVQILTTIVVGLTSIEVLTTMEILNTLQILGNTAMTSILEISPNLIITNILEIGPNFEITSIVELIPNIDITSAVEINLNSDIISIVEINPNTDIISIVDISPNIDVTSVLPLTGLMLKKIIKDLKLTYQDTKELFGFSKLVDFFTNTPLCFRLKIKPIFIRLKYFLYDFLFASKFITPGAQFQTIISMSPFFLLFVVTKRVKKKPVPTFGSELLDFYHIWPWHQWVFSLLGLVVFYWVVGIFYNWYLTSYGGWLSNKARIYMIIIDLVLNMIIGFHYMHYRNTFMGALTLQCPVAISPFIFWGEFVAVVIYYQWKQYKTTKKLKLEPKNMTVSKNESGLTVTGAAVMAEDPMSPQMRAALKKRHRGPMGTFLPSTEPNKWVAKLLDKLLDIISFIHYLFKKLTKRK